MPEAAPIDVERLRQTFDDASVLAELYSMYVHDTCERLAELRAAVASGDVERIRRTGHTLKGSSANIGAATMRVVAAQLEASNKCDGGDGVDSLISALEREFARVEAFVNDFIARAAAAK